MVIPVCDRAAMLERCLAALGDRYPVVVVDDGSRDPLAVATAAARHGAALIRRDVNGGPGAARNTALESVASDLVAFIDSDCVACPGLDRAAGPAPGRSAGRRGRSPHHRPGPRHLGRALHLGEREPGPRRQGRAGAAAFPGVLRPHGRPARPARALLPSAATGGCSTSPCGSARTSTSSGGCTRRAGASATTPPCRSPITSPPRWPALLARRYRYGTSAAPLARRHPGAVTHLVLHPWSAATVTALLARRPGAAAAGFCGLRPGHLPEPGPGRRPASGHGPRDARRGPADLAGHRPVRHAVRGSRAGRRDRRTWRRLGTAGAGAAAPRPPRCCLARR